MTTTNRDAREREAIEALLPWHAAGTLNRRDAERVEQALASDRELARHYDLVREELNETIHLNETLGAPSARAMEKLFAAIDAEQAAGRGAGVRKLRSLGLGARFTEFLTSLAPRTLAFAAGAAVLAIVLQAAVIATVFVRDQGGNYGVASVEPDGALVAVRFAPQASAADITKFLQAYKASVVGGPLQPGELYKLRISNAVLPQDEITRIVHRMAAEKVVGFAAPVQ
jgi:anti-sigma-K factor RskA